MLLRFCLYGFLKNQKYFEPFLILAFLEKGLSYFQIGLLISCREVTINLFEIISGALADVYGRRLAMIGSFCAYIASFLLFGLADHIALLLGAMFLFGIGDAFRTGTHKAMIFTWLRLQGRINERTKIYGQTRSWSQLGSAVSVVLAALFVILSNQYTTIFFFSIIPYALNIINFLGYPKQLDGSTEQRFSMRTLGSHLKSSLINTLGQRGLRRLIVESMGFEGTFKVTKDYLQPVLKSSAVQMGAAFFIVAGISEHRQVALLVGPVYFGLYLLSALASRRSHRFAELFNGEEIAAHWLWGIFLLVYGCLLPAMFFKYNAMMIFCFLLLFLLHNTWRPILISRFHSYGKENQGATILSIESQAKSLAAMIIAPLIGWMVDLVKANNLGGEFWPVSAFGITVGLMFFILLRSFAIPPTECPNGNVSLHLPNEHLK